MPNNSQQNSPQKFLLELTEIFKFLGSFSKIIITSILMFSLATFFFFENLEDEYKWEALIKITDESFSEKNLNLVSDLNIEFRYATPIEKSLSFKIIEPRLFLVEFSTKSSDEGNKLINEVLSFIENKRLDNIKNQINSNISEINQIKIYIDKLRKKNKSLDSAFDQNKIPLSDKFELEMNLEAEIYNSTLILISAEESLTQKEMLLQNITQIIEFESLKKYNPGFLIILSIGLGLGLIFSFLYISVVAQYKQKK